MYTTSRVSHIGRAFPSRQSRRLTLRPTIATISMPRILLESLDGVYHALSNQRLLDSSVTCRPGSSTGFATALDGRLGPVTPEDQRYAGQFHGDDRQRRRVRGSVAYLGDLDGPGPSVAAVAVARRRRRWRRPSRRRVHPLPQQCRNVLSYQKISDTQGNFTAVIDNADDFGSSVPRWDLDGLDRASRRWPWGRPATTMARPSAAPVTCASFPARGTSFPNRRSATPPATSPRSSTAPTNWVER